MSDIDDILDALAAGAAAGNSAGSEVVMAFVRLASLIGQACVSLGDPSALQAYELFQRNALEPRAWREPLGRALAKANAADDRRIMYMTRLLAVHLAADPQPHAGRIEAMGESVIGNDAYSSEGDPPIIIIGEIEDRSYSGRPAGDPGTELPDPD